jgi:hypothetical protein
LAPYEHRQPEYCLYVLQRIVRLEIEGSMFDSFDLPGDVIAVLEDDQVIFSFRE